MKQIEENPKKVEIRHELIDLLKAAGLESEQRHYVYLKIVEYANLYTEERLSQVDELYKDKKGFANWNAALEAVKALIKQEVER